MPKFHKDNRVYSDSLIQIAEGINDVVLRLNKSKLRFGPKKKFNKARTLNVLYFWFLRQHNTVQDAIVEIGSPDLYQHHEAEDRLEIPKDSVATTVCEKTHAYAAGDATAIHIDSKSKDALPRRKRTPKRAR